MAPVDDDKITITLRLFAGLRNPRWTLSANDARVFSKRLLESARAHPTTRRLEVFAWYRGFEIRRPGQSPQVVFGGFSLDPMIGSLRTDADRRLEQFLYESMPAQIRADLGNPTFAFMSRPLNERFNVEGIDGAGAVGDLPCSSAPRYPGQNGVWARDDGQAANNCYNYSNNEPARFGNSAIPGDRNVAAFTRRSLRAAAERDNLTFVGMSMPTTCPVAPKAHYLAICLRKQFGVFRDFHCLRIDKTGRWSHKDGPGPVRNTDDSDHRITDLRTARWKLEMDLVGFFLSDPATRRIRAPEDG